MRHCEHECEKWLCRSVIMKSLKREKKMKCSERWLCQFTIIKFLESIVGPAAKEVEKKVMLSEERLLWAFVRRGVGPIGLIDRKATTSVATRGRGEARSVAPVSYNGIGVQENTSRTLGSLSSRRSYFKALSVANKSHVLLRPRKLVGMSSA